MTTLAEHQRAVLDLLKNRVTPLEAEQTVGHMAHAPGIALAREIAVWWRTNALKGNCPLTSSLLTRMGAFEASVEGFYRRANPSPYAEVVAEQFLDMIKRDAHPLVGPMAAFELALGKVRGGDIREFKIVWDRNPDLVVESLALDTPLPAKELDAYVLTVSRDIPGTVRCARLTTQESASA